MFDSGKTQKKLSFLFQASADGYLPQEVEFIVIDNHPTLLNVTLHSAKVAQQEKYFIDSVLQICKYCTYNILEVDD